MRNIFECGAGECLKAAELSLLNCNGKITFEGCFSAAKWPSAPKPSGASTVKSVLLHVLPEL